MAYTGGIRQQASLSGDINFSKLQTSGSKLYATSIHAVTATDSLVVDASTKDIKGKTVLFLA